MDRLRDQEREGVMDEKTHKRRCWACGNVEEHKDSITPWVLCAKCGSQDTRRLKRLEPQKYPDYQVPAVDCELPK